MNILGAALAFAAGTGISALNWSITKKKLNADIRSVAVIAVIRGALNVTLPLALFFLRDVLPFSIVFTLVGAALGLTLPNIFFTLSMAKKPRGSEEVK